MNRRGLWGLALAPLLLAPSFAQERPDSSDQRPRFGASTAAVVVDVIVRDKDGNPVLDLTREDFQVFEDGKPQTIIDFERVMPDRSAAGVVPTAPDEGGTVEPGGAEAESADSLQGQAITAIVFDWLSPQARFDAWRAASTLLEQMEPRDYAAVFVIDQALRRVAPFTRDTGLLRAAFDQAVTRPKPGESRQTGAATAALVRQNDLAVTAAAEDGSSAAIAQSDPGDGATAQLAAFLARLDAWDRYMNREQQGGAVSAALVGLIEQMSGFPGRKTVVLFSEGLEVTDRTKRQFDNVEALANRHNITFYTLDAGGLRVQSRQAQTARQIPEAGGDNFSVGLAGDVMGRATELMWRDPTAGLEPLAERTGGFYVGNTNDLTSAFARINADRRFHYLLAYSSTDPELDGSYRKIEVKVKRRDVDVRARDGYTASPVIERTTRREYEEPALAALGRKPPPNDFPFQPVALSTPMPDHPGLTSLVASVSIGALSFRRDAEAGKYEGEATVMARIVSAGGDVVATASQLYRLDGELGKLDEVRQGNILFFRTPDVPPGRYTVEWVVRDGQGSRDSVMRSALDVPAGDGGPIVGDLFIVDRVEKAEKDDEATQRHPLAWNGMLLYPSLGAPISKADTSTLTFFLPVLIDDASSASMSFELLTRGHSLARNELKPGKARDGSLRQVGTLPLDRLPPGVYQLRVTVESGNRIVIRTAGFTLIDGRGARRDSKPLPAPGGTITGQPGETDGRR